MRAPSIDGHQQVLISFSNAEDARAKAIWSPNNQLTISKEGLGSDGRLEQSVDGWVQTKPLAVGVSWRTASSVSVSVLIEPAPSPFQLGNGQIFTPWIGRMFARFSPDAKHWSTWQELKPGESPTGRLFLGNLGVPQRERAEYARLLQEYSELDVPWRSDEEAAVKWILARDPAFFERSLPFIGYVEFLFEAPFYGGQRLASLRADAGFGMSGMHHPPKDPSVQEGRAMIPWRFKAE